ncbi:uncharacterized protein LOC128336356 [Hemicordylus capensis]|uniref:uncharacterized protein LOC128336356 n=1 Tax=Hemicordylus capensis TaxID=884348 RepID=UPI0023039F39|nr:uncharacterized protein LOC128336356 [Hemicordylus capensis]
MRYALLTMVLNSLVLQKDSERDPASFPRERMAPPCPEKTKLQQFRESTFCWLPAFCWVAESPWGVHLAGMAVLLLWAMVEIWVSSWLTALQTKPPRPVVRLDIKPEREKEVEIPQPTRSLCLCRTPASDFASYEPLYWGDRYSSIAYPDVAYPDVEYPDVAYTDVGNWHHDDILCAEYDRHRSPSPISKASLKDPCFSSSSSSSTSAFFLSRLKNLDLCSTSEKWSSAKDSVGTLDSRPGDEMSETKASISCSELDSSVSKEKEKTAPEGETETRPSSLEEGELQPLASFAQINILESYEKDDHIVFVERSLAIHMGPVPPLQVKSPTVTEEKPTKVDSMNQTSFSDQEQEEEKKPTTLHFIDQKSLQNIDNHIKHKHMASLQGLVCTVKKTVLKASGQTRPCFRPDVTSRATSPWGDFVPDSSVLKNMDEKTRCFLEQHVKKKMVQWHCGIPTVIAQSFDMVQSSLQSCRELESSGRTGKEKQTEVTKDSGSLAGLISPGRKSPAVVARHTEMLPKTEEDAVLHSVDPQRIRKLTFHAAVKKLEIAMAAFPSVVETSFQIFRTLSDRVLPKLIRFGNKALRLKHPSLTFIGKEALCIIDLNIKHKRLAHIWSLPTLSIESAAKMTSSSSEPEEDPAKRLSKKKPYIAESIWEPDPKGKALHAGASDILDSSISLSSPSSLSSPLVSEMTTGSSELTGPKKDISQGVSYKPRVTISIPDTWPKEKIRAPTMKPLAVTPELPESSTSSFSSSSFSPEKLSESYVRPAPSQKLLTSSVSSQTERTLEDPRVKTPPSLEPKEGVEADGKGTKIEKEAEAETEEGAKVDGRGTEPKMEEEEPISRTSIFLELELKKEKLNLHLLKKIEAYLQPQQRAAIEFNVDVDKAAGRKAKKPAPTHDRSGPATREKPRRPFCYVCMPLDETGSTVKTVCWALPKWILEMNGYRVPQVARFEGRGRGPRPAPK